MFRRNERLNNREAHTHIGTLENKNRKTRDQQQVFHLFHSVIYYPLTVTETPTIDVLGMDGSESTSSASTMAMVTSPEQPQQTVYTSTAQETANYFLQQTDLGRSYSFEKVSVYSVFWCWLTVKLLLLLLFILVFAHDNLSPKERHVWFDFAGRESTRKRAFLSVDF